MQERLIEKDAVRYAQDRGWLVYKWASPGQVGIHDRIFFQKSVAFTIEFKSTGQRATPKQRNKAIELKFAGIPCRCCDSVKKSREFIDTMTELLKESDEDILFNVCILSSDIKSFDHE